MEQKALQLAFVDTVVVVVVVVVGFQTQIVVDCFRSSDSVDTDSDLGFDSYFRIPSSDSSANLLHYCCYFHRTLN